MDCTLSLKRILLSKSGKSYIRYAMRFSYYLILAALIICSCHRSEHIIDNIDVSSIPPIPALPAASGMNETGIDFSSAVSLGKSYIKVTYEAYGCFMSQYEEMTIRRDRNSFLIELDKFPGRQFARHVQTIKLPLLYSTTIHRFEQALQSALQQEKANAKRKIIYDGTVYKVTVRDGLHCIAVFCNSNYLYGILSNGLHYQGDTAKFDESISTSF